MIRRWLMWLWLWLTAWLRPDEDEDRGLFTFPILFQAEGE